MKIVKCYFRYLFLFSFCVCQSVLQAQLHEIDSVRRLLRVAKEDTAKVNTLTTLADKLRNDDPDTSIYYAKEAIKLAEKINFKRGIGAAHLWWGIALTNLGKYNEALFHYAKARALFEQLLSSPKADIKLVKRLYALTFGNTGLLYYDLGNFPEALRNITIALKIHESDGDKRRIANSYANFGNIYVSQGLYTEALKNHFAALKLMEEINWKYGIADSHRNIANIYFNQKNYPEALKAHLTALKIYRSMEDKSDEAESYLKIANVYFEQGDYSEALKNSQASLKIQLEIGAKQGIASSYNNIGSIYFAQGNYTEALKNNLAALKIQEEIGYKLGIAESNKNIGLICQKQDKTEKAIEYAKKSLIIVQESGVVIATRDASKSLFESYKKAGKYKDALEMHELYVQSRDSVINEKNQKEILSQQFKYNYDKKALADSLNFVNQKKISDLKNESDRKAERNKRNVLYAGLGLVLVFSLFIFNRFRITAKQKKVIEYQNSQIVESINYSKQIQASLLPSLAVMEKELPGLFILYEPKDIVSGDFYWFKSFERYSILACVDCTGHGVPGGFMSTLGSLLLDKIVAGSSSPSEILSNLSTEIINVLHQQDGGAIQDGMDLSLCLIDHANKTIEFSGARNGIIVVTNGQAKKYKADLYPVGGNYLKKGKAIDRKFTTQKITVDKNDWIYMYTDGFVEQSGGDNGLPMNYMEFESGLISVSNDLNKEEKINVLQTQLNNWRGGYERTDDVLIIGFRVS